MPSLGPYFASAFSDPGSEWTSEASAFNADGNGAYHGVLTGNFSSYLYLTGFSIPVPANARIDGITVDIRALFNAAGGTQQGRLRNVQLIKGGIQQGDLKGPTSLAPGYANYLFGGVADKWGLTWLASDVSAPNFGVAIQVEEALGTGSADFHVDYARISVEYSLQPGKVSQTLLGVAW